MSHFKPLLSNKALTLSLLFFTILSTQQVSSITFKTWQFYPYFIAIGVVIYSIKIFFTSYSALSKEIQNKNNLGLLFNLGFVISQLWLLQIALQSLVTSAYPLVAFQTLAIASLIFVIQMFVNDYEDQRRTALGATVYYGAVFLGLYFYPGFPETLILQTICFLVPVLELAQLGKLIIYPTLSDETTKKKR